MGRRWVKNEGFREFSRFWQLRSSIWPTSANPIFFVPGLLDALCESLDSILKLGFLLPIKKVIAEKRKKMHFFGVFPDYFGNSSGGVDAVKSCFLDYFCRFMWKIWPRYGVIRLRSPKILVYRKGLFFAIVLLLRTGIFIRSLSHPLGVRTGRIASRTTTAVPGSPRPLLATSFLSQPLQIPIAIIPILYGPLEPFWWLSPLQDHQLCSRSTQSNPGYSMPIAATPDHHYHHISLQNYHEWKSIRLPDNSQQPGYSPGPPALFQTNHDLSWPIQTYYPSHSRPPTWSNITPELSQTSQCLPDHSKHPGLTSGPPSFFQAN